ncbi:MAG: M20/M25/M40 family metallo-hydrolase [bacterium]|nr:M20/M25/M40 family metallo-hydrolase [bacterium]
MRLRSFLIGLILLVCAVPTARAATPAPEPIVWLQEYLRIDTTNPPGNERPAAEFLARILEREGISTRLLVSPGGRTNLYARMEVPGSDGRAVVLVHHLDVVPAGDGWRVEPFSGRPFEGSLWGRGAIDIKSLGIAQLAALIAVKQEAARPGAAPLERDVVFLAVADEETGGAEGAAWLVGSHPELFAGVEAVLNEGGSNRVFNDRLIWWGIEVTQKRPLWLKVTAYGRGGHGSGLNVMSATHQLITGLARLIERPLRYRVTDAARLFFRALAEVEGGGDTKLYHRLGEVIREDGPTEPLAPGLPVFFVDTLQVTEIDNGRGTNVVSPRASAYVDIRLLPDTDADAYLRDVRELLGPDLEVELLLSSPQVAASPIDHPFYLALKDVLSVRAPVVPTFLVGITDSRFFRQLGIPAYGVSPFALNPPDVRGIHAPDEHIPIAEFLRGVETMRRILRAWTEIPGPAAAVR